MKTAGFILSLAILAKSEAAIVPTHSRGSTGLSYAAANNGLFERAPAAACCDKKREVVDNIGDISGVVTSVAALDNGKYILPCTSSIGSGVTASAVCSYRNKENCKSLGVAISAGLLTAMAVVGTVWSATHARDLSNNTNASFVAHLTNIFENHSHLGFESINALPVSRYGNVVTNSSIPAMSGHASITGLTFKNQSTNAIYAAFENGDRHIFVTPADSNTTNGGISKRVDGAGFKISYASKIPNSLSQSDQATMAQSFSDSWVDYADNKKIADYFGLLETNHYANLYFRIIPEIQGYGENYESVDACGRIADEL